MAKRKLKNDEIQAIGELLETPPPKAKRGKPKETKQVKKDGCLKSLVKYILAGTLLVCAGGTLLGWAINTFNPEYARELEARRTLTAEAREVRQNNTRVAAERSTQTEAARPSATATETDMPTDTPSATQTAAVFSTATSAPTTEPMAAQASGVIYLTRTIYVTNSARVRDCPRTDCAELTTYPAGTALESTYTVEGEDAFNSGDTRWYRIDYQGQDGFIYNGVVSLTAPAVTSGGSGTGSSGGSGGSADSGVIAPTAVPALARPANCDQAKEWGYTAEQAAQWSHLDRDNDGVACYGD